MVQFAGRQACEGLPGWTPAGLLALVAAQRGAYHRWYAPTLDPHRPEQVPHLPRHAVARFSADHISAVGAPSPPRPMLPGATWAHSWASMLTACSKVPASRGFGNQLSSAGLSAPPGLVEGRPPAGLKTAQNALSGQARSQNSCTAYAQCLERAMGMAAHAKDMKTQRPARKRSLARQTMALAKRNRASRNVYSVLRACALRAGFIVVAGCCALTDNLGYGN